MSKVIEVAQEHKEMEYTITQMIKDYRWMTREVFRLQNIIHGYSTAMTSWGVAQYGIEAVMPKGSRGKSEAEIRKIESLEVKRKNRLQRYEIEVFLLETLADTLKNEHQKVIYDCLLEGMTYREIGLHLGMSKDNVQEQKRDIVRQLRENEQMETFLLYGETH
ncbi:sigma-70 family RNA polymerase sigma factor (plasmid) [Lysinibacillus capsici]|uniref:sigma factor-like helix-turn-helix DNA-binding protein n=1 Tax=Lysinibacillus capsici TaxID=2115968 RepID=UPI0021DB25D8|nr:sigma factor-like helix-turn-helix DNA-binding protein [Lysinibacillus capsici]UYB50186.1 sigma-70 family RNA polymerase sigma factor [Lysinibacillus capsici]UYB50263.1 sigma-70 family RNA polymerase sigma factor [Lysinibacillus capsici]